MSNDPYVVAGESVTVVAGTVDRSITNLTGASQSVMLPEPRRKRIIIKNGAAPVAININGGTAAIGTADCMTFQAYEGFEFLDPPKGQINIIGTAANYCNIYEGL
jgi:hypothetical protein